MKFKAFLIVLSITSYSFSAVELAGKSLEGAEENKILWLDFETAMEKNEKAKKPVFIDVYTNWCGWCTKMDMSTFKDKEVIEFINQNFLAVKLNAEQKEGIVFKKKLYEYKTYGRSGYNELAVQLLNSKMSFPSYVILSKKAVKLNTIVGYKKPKELIDLLDNYVGK